EGTPAQNFFNSSFAARIAAREGKEAVLQQKLQIVYQRRAQANPQSSEVTWIHDIAFRTGLSAGFIESLHLGLIEILRDPPKGTKEWIEWFFGWLAADKNRLDAILDHRLSDRIKENMVKMGLFGTELPKIIQAWMDGYPLTTLNVLPARRSLRPGEM
ncbi:MAG TPA: hypothetical protein VIU12_31255, partial [Chryseolinea sp.]